MDPDDPSPDPDGPPPLPAAATASWGPDEPAPGPRRARPTAQALAAIVVGGLIVTGSIGVGAFRAGERAAVAAGLTAPDDDRPALRIQLDPADLDERHVDAACERVVDRAPLEERTHLDDDEAADLDADDLYPSRPPHSGRHLGQWLPVQMEAFTDPVDERAVVHNLEHGAIAVFYDPDRLDDDEVAALEAWTRSRNEGGFGAHREPIGTAVITAPAPADGISSGGAIALRAWGVATDCDRFDEVVADGFLADHFGDRGIAPEGHLAPYPDGAIEVVRPDA